MPSITDMLFGSPSMSPMLAGMSNSLGSPNQNPLGASFPSGGMAGSGGDMSSIIARLVGAMGGAGGAPMGGTGAMPNPNPLGGGGMDWNSLLMQMFGMGGMGGPSNMFQSGGIGNTGPTSMANAGGLAPLMQAIQGSMAPAQANTMASPINALMRYR